MGHTHSQAHTQAPIVSMDMYSNYAVTGNSFGPEILTAWSELMFSPSTWKHISCKSKIRTDNE